MKLFRSVFFFLPASLLHILSFAQPATYILNGTAVQNTCNCYTLTPAINTQSGSVWNAAKINLNNPFDFVFNVFLGCTDANGADGIVFILQPVSTSVGATGGGLGFEGITPSVGVVLDTWQNSFHNDPAEDHISINANGNLVHGTDLAGPIQASSSGVNIEDCQWHTLRISWDPVSHSLKTYFDGTFRLETTVDLIATIFHNDPWVYWGFSAGTGGSNNLQQFCTALNPGFTTNAPADATCLGNAINFSNTSQSFAPIASFYWNFGDGSTTTVANPPPHIYAAAGLYEVKLAITGLDGCNSDTLRKTIAVGDYPVANFDIYDTCFGLPPRIIERSQVTVGSISKWNWMLDGTAVSVAQQPQLTNLSPGVHQLQLTVTSNHGCASAPVTRSFTIKAKPLITATGVDGCVNEPLSFTANQMDNATTIINWNWKFGDNQISTLQNPQHSYSSVNNYTVQVFALSSDGCSSDVITIPVFINRAIANAGNDTIVLKDIPFQLHATGGMQYSWSPSIGLNNTTIADPVAALQDDITYLVTVTTPEGCVDGDHVSITVFKGSTVFVPNGFTPNNDGLNDRLKPYYVGIRSLDYFTVYNRWGETVFTTKDLSAGWNGIYKGMLQPSGTYVWMLKATDYVGKVYEIKGTSIIIR
ncbi:MAG TPA: PKD domain-containing protein [Chitinophagaceae bacterium]